MNNTRELLLPRASGTTETVQTTNNILLIGANGSGKSRLGAWIELNSPQRSLVYRISAQKSLAMPDTTTPVAIDHAMNNLLFGHPHHTEQNKQSKWNGNPVTSLASDYEKLMVYLFSDETEENAKFKAAYKATDKKIDAPVTKIDKVKEVWERVLPHRELIIGGLRIQTRVKGSQEKIYPSSEMSDGERVIFYLIGQCLAAPKNGIIVIDEPELHLHKSIQAKLWAEIQKLRSDCLFVYLTHDVDFAVAQEAAIRIWLKSFDGTLWEWEKIETEVDLPDELLLEVLGSRKPVVFVEGTNGSYDVSLYRELLDGYLVVPRGSCSQVILTVKAFKANAQFHNLDVFGIIDRDRRVEAEIIALEKDSIYVLKVAEVENIFCTKEVITMVSQQLIRDDSEGDFNTVANQIFTRLEGELETQVSLHVTSGIQFELSRFESSSKGMDAMAKQLGEFLERIDVREMYAERLAEFRDVIDTKNFEKLLEIYNRKSLANQVGDALGLKKNQLFELTMRLARGEHGQHLRSSLQKYFGNFRLNSH